MKKHLLLIVLFFFVHSFAAAQTESELYKRLKSFKEIVEIKKIDIDTTFREAYEIYILQPIDHNNPAGKKFKQKVFLSHRNFDAPVVMALEGYSAGRNRTYELTNILAANQINIEHRYFGNSVPEEKDWQYLNIKQSAADHHNIVLLFKKIYSGKWVSTGISKGGQTTIFHKRFHPEDVDVAVPYVAPVNLAQEDPRIYMFLNSVGSEECREKILKFQRAFLEKRQEILPLLLQDIEKSQLRLAFDYEFVLEYMTLEYSFAFWQWGATKCEEIPSPNDSAGQLYEHMKKSNPLYFFTQAAMDEFGPFYVQAYNEIGYYGYDLTPFKDLLTEIKNGSNIFLLPEGVKINYDCSVMQDINNWLLEKGNNMIFIYGGNDTWSATSVQLTGRTNALKMVRRGGSHGTHIRDFPPDEKELIYSTLEKWLELKIKRDF